MAPSILPRALFEEFIAETSASHHMLAARSLKVNTAQSVTLGIIAVYVVVIALLWNIPYVRMVLWPFKVRCVAKTNNETICQEIPADMRKLDAHDSLSRVRACDYINMHRRKSKIHIVGPKRRYDI